MKIRKRIELTIETEKFLSVRLSGAKRGEFCELCESQRPLMSVPEMAELTKMSSRAIFKLIGDGQLHFRETAAGLLLVCFDSLSAAAAQLLRCASEGVPFFRF